MAQFWHGDFLGKLASLEIFSQVAGNQLVPGAGLEPARSCEQGILNPHKQRFHMLPIFDSIGLLLGIYE